jgi:DNA-binding transcriptional LysR family regulator
MPRREQGVPPGATLPDLEDLRVLCAVVDEGGVNSAARKLGQPRSSVSRRLTRLEGRLGARLFHRSHQELTLTPEGVRLTERARRLIDDAETLVRDARGVASEVRGRLRVSAPLDLAEDRAFWTTAFTAHPEVTFEIELTNRYVDVVREGFDVALRAGRGTDEELVVRRMGSYALRAVASPAYVRAHGQPRTPAELRAHSCVVLAPFAGRPDRPGPGAPHRHLVVNSQGIALEGAMGGLGIAILPAALVAPHLESGALVPALDAYDPLLVPMYAAYPERKLLPATLRAFLDHVERTLASRAEATAPPARLANARTRARRDKRAR